MQWEKYKAVTYRNIQPRNEPWWLQRFDAHCVKHQQPLPKESQPQIVFLGDSIVHRWEDEGIDAWMTFFAAKHCVNLGYGGDCTEHMLWRLKNGELGNLQPQWFCVLAGTNNAGHFDDSPQSIASGVQSIVEQLKVLRPSARIVLNAIFPRSKAPNQRLRIRVEQTNLLLKALCDEKQVFWLNMSAQFLTKDGVLEANVMSDFLHPNSPQYVKWGEQIERLINDND